IRISERLCPETGPAGEVSGQEGVLPRNRGCLLAPSLVAIQSGLRRDSPFWARTKPEKNTDRATHDDNETPKGRLFGTACSDVAGYPNQYQQTNHEQSDEKEAKPTQGANAGTWLRIRHGVGRVFVV